MKKEEKGALVKSTLARLAQANLVLRGRDVEVFRGKKVPHGVYEVISEVVEDHHNKAVHLKGPNGSRFGFVPLDYVRVHRPGQYINGSVACSWCEKSWPNWAAGDLRAVNCGHLPYALCPPCERDGVLRGVIQLEIPRAWRKRVPNWWEPVRPLDEQIGPQEALLVLALYEDPDDLAGWLAYSDYLEENPFDEEKDEKRRLTIALMTGRRKLTYPVKVIFLSDPTLKEGTGWQTYTHWEATATGFSTVGLTFDRVRVDIQTFSPSLRPVYPERAPWDCSLYPQMGDDEVLYTGIPEALQKAVRAKVRSWYEAHNGAESPKVAR